MTIRLMLASSQMATAPTLDAQDEVKEAFYADLDKNLSKVPKEDKLILLGESGAKPPPMEGFAGERRKGWKYKLQYAKLVLNWSTIPFNPFPQLPSTSSEYSVISHNIFPAVVLKMRTAVKLLQ